MLSKQSLRQAQAWLAPALLIAANFATTVSSRARWAARVAGRQASIHHTVAFRIGKISAVGRLRIEPSMSTYENTG